MSSQVSSKHEENSTYKESCRYCSERWRLAFLGVAGFSYVYALRINLSVAIVCMVKADNSSGSNVTSSSCAAEQLASDTESRGEFDWDKGVQSSILSSFFYGYLVMQVPGGWLAGKFGGKRVLGTGLTVVALATVLLPELARVDYRFVYALRVIMGVASSVSYPAMHAMWGRWAPPAERSRLASSTYSGLMIGTVTTSIVSGYLCAFGFDNGWGSIFYITGGTCFLWLAAWWWLVSDSPDNSPRITAAERDYIVRSIGDRQQKNFSVPWRKIARSRALWVCLTAHFCNNWMHYTLVTSLPTFMKEVLHYDIKQNGLMTSVPFMAKLVVSIIGGHLADFLRARYLSTRTTRRLIQAVSFTGGAACLVGAGYVGCEHRTIAVVLLAVAVGFEGLCYSGFIVNHIDFAPRYAGVLYGITNLISTIPGILAPQVAGLLTPNKSQEEWRNVFYLCGGFSLFGALIFGCFAQTDTEPWARGPDDPSDDVRNKELAIVAKDHGTGKSAYVNKGLNVEEGK